MLENLNLIRNPLASLLIDTGEENMEKEIQ
jgi:hypothetical protein